jgi:hypothetical protein
MNARFFCSVESCGRGFQTEKDLNLHLSRRHGIEAPLPENTPKVEDSLEASSDLKHRLFGSKRVQKNAPIKPLPTDLSNLLILEACGEESIEETTEVILK